MKSKLILLLIFSVLIPFLIVNEIVLVLSENKIINQTTTIVESSADQTYTDVKNLLLKYVDICNGYCYNDSLIQALGQKYEDGLSSLEAYNRMDRTLINDIMATNFRVNIRIYFFNDTFSPDYVTFFMADDEIKRQGFYKTAMELQNNIIWGDENDKMFLVRSIHNNNENLGIFKMDIMKDETFAPVNKYSPDERLIIICDNDGKVIVSNKKSMIGNTIKNEKYFKLAITGQDMIFDYQDKNGYKAFSHSFN
jgi:hypothetical protein